MKNSLAICLAPLTLMLAACSSGGRSGADANSDVPKEASDAARTQILEVSFKNCGEYWGSVYKRTNPLDYTTQGEFQFKNLRMVVEKFGGPLSEADKMNGIQWEGLIKFSADVFRERSIGAKDWSPWNEGFGAPYNAIQISVVNGKIKMNGDTALRAACPQ